MAIGFRAITQAASGGTSGTSTISAPAFPTGTASGDLVVLIVGFKYGDSITMTAPAGWTVVSNNEAANSTLTNSGNDSGNVRGAVFFRQYDGVWTMPSITTSANYDVSMRGVVSYTKGAAEAWVTPVCANAVDNSVSSVGLDPAASGTTIPIVSGDWVGSVGFQNGDVGTFSSHNIAVSGITFGTQATRLGAASTVGTDMRIHSIDRPWSSGTAAGGPDGSVVMTTGGGNDAGVMVFYRLRVAPLVTAVLAAPLGALTGTFSATVTHPPVTAVLVAPLGSLAGTIAATTEHPAVLAAPMGGLSATGTATPRHGVVLAAGLGGLAAAITATPEHPATLAAPLGSLTATASATVTSGSNTVTAVLSAPLGALAGTATATPEHPVTAVAACGALTATAAATVRHSALGAAPLGTLSATASATATAPPVVPAVLVSNLGQLVAMANAGPPPPRIASVGFERFDVPAPAWGEVISWVDYLNEPMWEDFYI